MTVVTKFTNDTPPMCHQELFQKEKPSQIFIFEVNIDMIHRAEATFPPDSSAPAQSQLSINIGAGR